MMWLTKIMNQRERQGKSPELGSVTKSLGRSLEVDTFQPHGNMKKLSPFGIAYVPAVGSDALVVYTGQTQLCVGTVCRENEDLESGEIRIFSTAGNSVTLKKDGKILIEGDVYINGQEVSLRSGHQN